MSKKIHLLHFESAYNPFHNTSDNSIKNYQNSLSTENQNKSEILIDSTCFLHKIEKLSFSLPSPKFVVSLNTININFSSIVL